MDLEEKIPSLEEKIASLESKLTAIEARNLRVESDKAWETSIARILSIVVMTYIGTSLVFYLIAVPRPLFNALIPTLGYFLSTQTLRSVRRFWTKYRECHD